MSDVSADEVLVAKTDLQAGALRLPEVLMQSVTLVAPGSLPNDGKVIDDVRKYS
jgi:hypothetical protein